MEVEAQTPPTIELSSFPPVMPWREFARWTRNEEGIVRGWIDRGYLPTVRHGKHVQINVALYVRQLLEQEGL